MRFSLARRELEESWGIANLEVPLSEVCQTDGFLLVSFAPAGPVAAGTARSTTNRLTSTAKPMESAARTIRSPALAGRESGWRRPSGSGGPRLRGAGHSWCGSTLERWTCGSPAKTKSCSNCRWHRNVRRVAPSSGFARSLDLGVRLRTRALTTTMFCRFMLGDLFLHGIGGAKYDELGDEIARRFFRIEPPSFLTVSMTLWLGLPTRRGPARRSGSHRQRIARPSVQSGSPSVRTGKRRRT